MLTKTLGEMRLIVPTINIYCKITNENKINNNR